MNDVTSAPGTELTIIDRSIEQFTNAAAILRNNQTRAEKAVGVGRNILTAYEAAGKVMTPEMDARMQKYLANCNAAKKDMNEGRKNITQTLTMIAKAFTSEENKLDVTDKDTVAYQIQQIRNNYARQVHEEEQKRQREIELQRQKDQEAINIKAEAEKRLLAYVGKYTADEKVRINGKFNAITLESFDAMSAALSNMVPAYPYAHFKEFLHGVGSRLFSAVEIDSLLKVHLESKFNDHAEAYKKEIGELKNYLCDRLPSKYQELLSIKAMEEERERERIEQERIQREQAQANEQRRAELEQERLASLERQRIADEERRRQLEEQRQREEQERRRLEAEERERQDQQQQSIDQQKEVETTMSLFSSEVATADNVNEKPEVRQGYEIEVFGPAAYMAMFQQWFTIEGMKMTNEELDKKLDFVRKFCEKLAHKDETKMIQSVLLRYKPSFKAVNRKTKSQ